MFSATLDEGNILKKIVEAIKDIVSNVNIEAGPNGITMQAMDPTHVALVSLDLKADGFSDYRADKNFQLGVKLNSLHKILKCAGNSDTITLKCEEEPSQLTLRFTNENQEASFNLNLMNLEGDQLQIPATEYNSKIVMPSGDFSKVCKELSQISENVKIETTTKSLILSVNGEIGNGTIEKKENNSSKLDEQITIDVDDPIANTFSLGFLNSFNKAAPLSEQVNLCFNEDSPLVVSFTIGDLGKLSFYLAPKINEE